MRGYGNGPLVIVDYIISRGGIEQPGMREIGEDALGRTNLERSGQTARQQRFFVAGEVRVEGGWHISSNK